MFYVRAGLPIQELAFLGRWRSSVVLQYAEEALQEKAVNIPRLENQHEKKSHRPPQGEVNETPLLQVDKPMKDSGENHFEGIAQAFSNPHDLWVVTKGRGWRGRPMHRVIKATWSLPIREWTTSCGWQFAAQSTEFYFLSGKQGDKVKCNKCMTLEKARLVREG